MCGYVDVAPIFIPKRKNGCAGMLEQLEYSYLSGKCGCAGMLTQHEYSYLRGKNGCAGMLEQRKYSYLGGEYVCMGMLEQCKYSYLSGEYGGAGMLEVPNERKGMSAMKPKICRKILNGVALVGMGIAFFANIPALKPIRMEMIYGAAFLVIADVIFGLLFLRARTVKNY